MKYNRIASLFAAVATMALSQTVANAQPLLEADFSKGDFTAQGWTPKGSWTIIDYGADKPDLKNNPGPVAKFAAGGKTAGTLTHAIPATKGGAFTLTFDAGYGWGSPTHSQSLQVMLVDDNGNGYAFDAHRAKATWGVQWALVSAYGYNNPMTWASAPIDTTQGSIVAGSGLRTFTISRDASGSFEFNGDGWVGGPLKFTDTTTTSFTQIVLRGGPNTDEIVFGKLKLETK
jgi:hypothetical protein